MLREQSQRRVQAERKERWAEYRLAKEAALGKPMRRQLASCGASHGSATSDIATGFRSQYSLVRAEGHAAPQFVEEVQ